MELNRGDIVVVNLYPKKGDEVGKIRPALIISGDDENSILDTVILMPLSTTDLIEDIIPYRMRIAARDNLKQDSDILINQIRTLSKIRIKGKIAKLTDDEYAQVIENLCKNFK